MTQEICGMESSLLINDADINRLSNTETIKVDGDDIGTISNNSASYQSTDGKYHTTTSLIYNANRRKYY